MSHSKAQVAHALKSIARNEKVKSYIQESNELYPILLQVAKRFVTGESREEGMATVQELISKGYDISLEYIGENIRNIDECRQATNEFVHLIEEMSKLSSPQTVSLDLSHIGLSVSEEAAFVHIQELAEQAKRYGINLMISMEESAKTDDILNMYRKISKQYTNVGITIQAHLYRSEQDIQELIHYTGKIRIVKGAYQEPTDRAVPRSKELNQRYLKLVDTCVKAKHPVSIATHDETLINALEQQQYLHHPDVEIEMLYGIRADLLRALKNKGYKTRVYLTYGQEWYLYLCHRLAEHPENIYDAIIDLIDPSIAEKSRVY